MAGGKLLIAIGVILLVGGAAPWVYWILRAVEGGRGSIPSGQLPAVAVLAVLGGLATTIVGVVKAVRAALRRERAIGERAP